jgi:glycosyltransferase involved in cell wall biosynthesis
MKFLFVCSHQIQNLIPLFVELEKKKNLNFKVIYWEKLSEYHFDAEFKQKIDFNIDLYKRYSFYSLSKEKNSTKGFFTFFNKLRITLKLIRLLVKGDFDRVLFYGYYYPHIIASIFSKILGKKTIIRSVSYNLGNRNIIKKFARYCYYNFANFFFDEFWSICNLNTNFFLLFGANKNKISLIPSCQITKEFVIKENEKSLLNLNKIKEDNNLMKNKKFILFAGKFNFQKRPLFLLEAFVDAKLSEEWCLVMSGGGGIYHDDVIKFIEKNNTKNITFVGYKNLKEMIGLYTISDIVILPSDYGETHGNVLMEATQFECALITSDRTGIHPEILREEMGLVFEGSLKSELTKKIQLLTSDINLLNKLKKNGIKYSEKIKPQYTANKMIELLNKK